MIGPQAHTSLLHRYNTPCLVWFRAYSACWWHIALPPSYPTWFFHCVLFIWSAQQQMAFISGVPAVFPGLFLCWCESAQSQATLQMKYHGNSTSSSLTCLSAHSGHNCNEVAEMPDVTMMTPLKRQVCHHLVLQVTPLLMMNWRYAGRFACFSFRWYMFSLS